MHISEFFGHPNYVIYSYDEIQQVLSDSETFTSRVFEKTLVQVFGPSIIAMDGHEHVAHRNVIGHAFRLKALEEWKTTLIEPIVHSLLDRIAGTGEAELVRDFNIRFPIQVIARMLGIPAEDSNMFVRRSLEMISIAVDVDRGLKASAALRDYLAPFVEERRRDPKDDLISTLATAEIDGHRLPDEHIYGFLRLLLPAGAETTYRLLGNLLFAMLTHPDQLEELASDRSLMPAAIEETLRWEAPVQQTAREVTRDGVEIAGIAIGKGEQVSVILGSGNRDESKWEDPDRFDMHRRGPAHLAFGGGAHYCIGAHLGRLETTVALNAMLDRFKDLRFEPGDADPHVKGVAFRSPTSLPVRFAPE